MQDIRLYYARIHDRRDQLEIHAEFDNQIILGFTQIKQIQIDHHKTSNLFIYALDLTLKKDVDGQFYLRQYDQWKPIENISFLGIRRIAKLDSTITYHEKNIEGHTLDKYLDNKHQFLLNIEFDSKLATTLPGFNTNGFINLCLFTCFLLNERDYGLFDILNEQFQHFVDNQSNGYRNFKFTDFFDYCNRFLVITLTNANEIFVPLKIIIRMIGLLTIPNDCFYSFDKVSLNFTNQILEYIKIDFNTFYKSIHENERLTFNNGLVTLICIKLIFMKKRDDNVNEIGFFKELLDGNQHQKLAQQLLERLEQLNKSFESDPNWFDLLILVDPSTIKVEHLNFTHSLTTFVQCISAISNVLQISNEFLESFKNYFEIRVSKKAQENHFLSINLDDLVYLLNFLTDTNSTFLASIQSTIINSSKLNERMKAYFQHIHINEKNMKDVSQVLMCAHKYSFLKSIERIRIFRRTLIDDRLSKYYIQWFQCFLAKISIWKDLNPSTRREYFEKWSQHALSTDRRIFDIFSSMDGLLDSFDSSDETDPLSVAFIRGLLPIIFSPNSK